MTKHIDIVLSDVKGTPDCKFVEIENAGGKSISLGTWVRRPDGFWAIRITREDIAGVFGTTTIYVADPPQKHSGLSTDVGTPLERGMPGHPDNEMGM